MSRTGNTFPCITALQYEELYCWWALFVEMPLLCRCFFGHYCLVKAHRGNYIQPQLNSFNCSIFLKCCLGPFLFQHTLYECNMQQSTTCREPFMTWSEVLKWDICAGFTTQRNSAKAGSIIHGQRHHQLWKHLFIIFGSVNFMAPQCHFKTQCN